MTDVPSPPADTPTREGPRARWRRWLIDLAIVAVLITAVSAWQARGHARGPAPPFSLRTLDGAVVDNAALAGKRTMLVFWAPWCGVCRVESGAISTVHRLVGDAAHVVSVASEYESLREVTAFVDAAGVDYPVLLGGTRTARAFGVTAFPTIYFVDEQGGITRSVSGYSTTLGLLWRLLL